MSCKDCPYYDKLNELCDLSDEEYAFVADDPKITDYIACFNGVTE